MSKKNILFINGVADYPEINLKNINSYGKHIFGYKDNANLSDYLQSTHFNKVILNFDANRSQKIRLPKIDAIFNQISNANTHQVTLTKVTRLYNHLSKKVPMLNTPFNIKKINRDNLYTLLQGIEKLYIPKTIKIQPTSPSDIYDVIEKENFKFPVMLRQTSERDNISTLLIEDKSEQFHILALDGSTYYLTQFVNYRLKGLYQKMHLAVVNGEVFISDVQFSENWLIDHQNQLSNTDTNIMRKSISERFESEIKPVIQPTITEIYNRLGLDYFVIDCHIDQDKNISIFKISPSIDIFAADEKNIFTDHISMIHKKLIQMIDDKLN